MERDQARGYKKRRRRVNEVTEREQREASAETKLRRSTGLLQLSRRIGWDLRYRETKIESARANWNRLRAGFRERQS